MLGKAYGDAPQCIGKVSCNVREMMFYQDMPLKLPGEHKVTREERLMPFDEAIGVACCDFIGTFGLDRYVSGHVYISAKRLFQSPHCTFNRQGWHCDGFGSDDINYIWYDRTPTVFNCSAFDLPADDAESMLEMGQQALPVNDRVYECGMLLRLDQYNVHRTALPAHPELRTFLKISFSRDRYDLEGNTRNPLLSYEWPMRPRGMNRNIPQLAA